MGRSGGVLWWFFSVWISYICSPSEGTGILEITISFMATCRCFTWNAVFWKSIQRLGKLIYTNGGSQKNASSILLLLTSKKWLCVLIPWEAEPHFPTTEWASLLHVFVDVSRETRWVRDGFGVRLPSPTSCCQDWCFTWNHSANGKHPSRRPTMFHVKHRHFHKQYSPRLQLCFVESVSVSLHV